MILSSRKEPELRKTDEPVALRLDLAIIPRLIQEVGVFGQAFFPNRRSLVFSVIANIACLSLLTSCAADPGELLQSGRVLAWAGSEGRWVGPVTPVDAGCGAGTTGLMSIGNGTFAFDPFQSTDVLHGKISAGGDLNGESVRPIPQSRSVTTVFLGRIQQSDQDEQVIGTLTSGRCRWVVTLQRG
jgi:hypothetical protein